MAMHIKKEKRRRSNVSRIVLLTVAALILGLALFNWNAKSLTGNRMPMPFGVGASVVMSGSMEERLSVNDLIIVKKTDSYAVNDIVVYQDGNILVVHRIIAIDGDTVTTQGDANNAADEPIEKDRIKGVVVFDIPGIGAVVNIIKHPISVCVILAAIVLLTEFSYRKEKDKDTDELDEIKAEIEKLMKDLKDE